MPHVFALRDAPGVPPKLHIRGLPDFGHGYDEERRRLIEDDDVAAELREYNQQRDPTPFRRLSAEQLEDALGSADGAIDAIEAGEYDDVLDLLLYAERRGDRRVTVIDAIDDRRRKFIEERHAESEDPDRLLTPDDVAPKSLG